MMKPEGFENFSICVQAFNKVDTLRKCLNSIKSMKNVRNTNLIICQDGIDGSARALKFADQHELTSDFIKSWVSENSSNFQSVQVKLLNENHGTCRTTQLTIDLGLEVGSLALFTEDDVIFESDALNWFYSAMLSKAFRSSKVLAIAGESKVFDSRGRLVSQEMIIDSRELALKHQLINKYILFNFVPSSSFLTNREKWNYFRQERGQPNGDRDVNIKCRNERLFSLWPVIARCDDIGMHHPLGYSVNMKKGNLDSIPNKSVYLLSGDVAEHIELEEQQIEELDKNLAFLFSKDQ